MGRLAMKTQAAITAAILTAALAACTSDDAGDATPKENDLRPRRLVITQDDDTATRALLTPDAGNLAASWQAADELTYCNLTSYQLDPEAGELVHPSGQLTATTTALRSPFQGTVTCNEGDNLAVAYPATTFSTLTATPTYTINLAGQDGTLTTLARNYHYVYGVARVTSATETTATATMAQTRSLLAVCRFSFTDGNNPIHISTLEICYGGIGSDAETYPQTATITCSSEQTDVHATADPATTPLTLTIGGGATEAYVALLPTGGARTFRFTVEDGSGNTYTGTADATLVEGEYVVAEGLRLTKL